MSESKNTSLRVIAFCATGGVAYIGLRVLGQESAAFQQLVTSLKAPLQELLSFSAASLVALIIPPKRPPETTSQTEPPAPKAESRTDDGQQALGALQYEYDKLHEWATHAYRYYSSVERSNRVLDRRQELLRLSLFAGLAISVLLCIFGFFAPRPDQDPLGHYGLLTAPYALTAFVFGIVTSIRASSARPIHAIRVGGISSLFLNTVTLFVGLPYAYSSTWSKRIMVGTHESQIFMFVLIFRLAIMPIAASLAAYVGFRFSTLFLKRRNA